MRKIMFLFVLLITIVLLCACDSSDEASKSDQKEDKAWTALQDSGELVIGTAGTLFPSTYYPEDSDELTGYEVEVARELADRLGLEAHFEIMDFDSMLTALSTNRVDIILAGPREESRKKFAFSEPVKYSYSTMVVRTDDHSGIETLDDLKGKKAGGAATTVYSEIAEKYDAEVVTYGNATNDAYLRDVDNGRTDTVINDYYLQRLALTAFPELDIELHPDLKFHPTTDNVVMKQDYDVLMDKVNEAINEMKADGTIAGLSAEFFDGEDVSKEPEEEITEIEGIE